MPDFNVRSDSVNVEQIMEQLRARVREKRGVDYTEQQIRELAAVKLEKFLDPRGVRSDLLDQFRNTKPDARPNYAFEEETLFETHRAPIRWIRRLLRPVLKLLFNPNPLIQALHIPPWAHASPRVRQVLRRKDRGSAAAAGAGAAAGEEARPRSRRWELPRAPGRLPRHALGTLETRPQSPRTARRVSSVRRQIT